MGRWDVSRSLQKRNHLRQAAPEVTQCANCSVLKSWRRPYTVRSLCCRSLWLALPSLAMIGCAVTRSDWLAVVPALALIGYAVARSNWLSVVSSLVLIGYGPSAGWCLARSNWLSVVDRVVSRSLWLAGGRAVARSDWLWRRSLWLAVASLALIG